MEVVTILLTSLIGLVSPLGFVADGLAASTLRSQFQSVEQLQVRVDNAPSYQIIQGKADRFLVALRGAFPQKNLRIAALDIEAEGVDVDVSRGKPQLNRPLQTGIRLVLTQADINRALQSPEIANQFRNIAINLPNVPQARQVQRYDFLNPRMTILPDERLRFEVDLQEQGYPDRLPLMVEFGLKQITGRRLQLVAPAILLGGEAAPPELLENFTQGLNAQLDLQNLEKLGMTVRVLRLRMMPEQQMEIAIFLRIEVNNPLLAQF